MTSRQHPAYLPPGQAKVWDGEPLLPRVTQSLEPFLMLVPGNPARLRQGSYAPLQCPPGPHYYYSQRLHLVSPRLWKSNTHHVGLLDKRKVLVPPLPLTLNLRNRAASIPSAKVFKAQRGEGCRSQRGGKCGVSMNTKR